ncbi:hypothetical protein B296_00006123 [Ensete ventricosum]|uniref:Uncharacterized protein n=1 Tax=Ensete ventricosum TaxID=4639 RepID=A0A427AA62_ENSVE|nr:hypothetical protein B296_00006123 [Ensete ventricosum]
MNHRWRRLRRRTRCPQPRAPRVVLGSRRRLRPFWSGIYRKRCLMTCFLASFLTTALPPSALVLVGGNVCPGSPPLLRIFGPYTCDVDAGKSEAPNV